MTNTSTREHQVLGDFASAGSNGLRSYVDILAQRKWLIVAVCGLVTALAVAFSFTQAKRYQAIALVEVSRQNLSSTITGNASATPVGTDFSRVLQTDAVVANSLTVAQQAARLAGQPAAGRRLLANSTVATNPDDDLLSFTVSSTLPDEAVRLANAYARAYTQQQTALDTAALQKAEQGVAGQIARLQRSKAAIAPSLLSSRSELQVLTALQSSNTTVARTASSAGQVSPRPIRNGVLGFVIGLVLGVAVALLVHSLDARIKDRAEISDRFGVPVIGRIAPPPRRLRSSSRLVVVDEPHGPGAEAFRILRANLEALPQPVAGCVVVTSAVSGEGKSTTAANLAVMLARGGSKVVLADFDLRKPTVATLFNVPPSHPGVTSVVLGHSTLDEALVAVDVADDTAILNDGALAILPAGPATPSAGELISGELITPLFQQLRERADIVILDSPPALGVSDVTAVASRVDGILVVARIGLLTRRHVNDLGLLLERLPAPVIGIVVTGAEPGLDNYGYGYGYGTEPSNGRTAAASRSVS